MLKEGDLVYFEEDGQILSGKAIHVEQDTFEIEGYGCCCEGNCRINQSMIGYTFFLTRKACEEKSAYMR